MSSDLPNSEGEIELQDELGPAITLPKGTNFEDPLSPEVWMWLAALAKATKGIRIYAENNRMLEKFINDAYSGLENLLNQVPELAIRIREDRLLYNKDAVYVNSDREEGIPFTLYRNAFRKLTFVEGMTKDELLSLMKAISTDYSYFSDSGDDLVTSLWRLALPNLRYLTIDAIAIEAKTAKDDGERKDIERIQGDIEGIVAAIYQTSSDEGDLVAGVSIGKEDLEALKEVREEADDDLDSLDHATARAITDITKKEIETVQIAVDLEDTRENLQLRLVTILADLLLREESAKESAPTLELMRQLYESLVFSRQYGDVTDVVLRFQRSAHSLENVKQAHVSQHLIRMFAHESRVTPILDALNDGYSSTSVSETMALLRALGPSIVPTLVSTLETVDSPTHRRLLCDLIMEFGVPDVSKLSEIANRSKWFVVRDILNMATAHPPETITPLIAFGLGHENPKVRAHAVGMLKGYARGHADKLIAERLLDDDLEVRLAAIRIAGVRGQSPEARTTMQTIIGNEEALAERDPRELRMLMMSYAAMAGADSVPALDHVLNPGFFAKLKSTEPQIAAALALGSIGTEEAIISIQKGMRTLNTRVREACRKALGRDKEKQEEQVEIAPNAAPMESGQVTSTSGAGGRLPLYRGTSVPRPEGAPEKGPDPSFKMNPHAFMGTSEDQQRTQVGPPPVPNKIPRSTTAEKLKSAPAFEVTETTEEKSEPINVVHRSGPALARVNKPHREVESMPMNLPPATVTEKMPVNLPPASQTVKEERPPIPPATTEPMAMPDLDLPVELIGKPHQLPLDALQEPETSASELMPANLPQAPVHQEVMPSNLPPAPSPSEVMPANLPPAPVQEVMPSNLPPAPSPSHAEVMPSNLPPAPSPSHAEVMPANLPPAPSLSEVMPANLPPAPVQEVMPSNLPPAPVQEVMPSNLPPAPVQEVMPSNLPPAPARQEVMPANLPPAAVTPPVPAPSQQSEVMPANLPPAPVQEVMPANLPPAPAVEDGMPDILQPDPEQAVPAAVRAFTAGSIPRPDASEEQPSDDLFAEYLQKNGTPEEPPTSPPAPQSPPAQTATKAPTDDLFEDYLKETDEPSSDLVANDLMLDEDKDQS